MGVFIHMRTNLASFFAGILAVFLVVFGVSAGLLTLGMCAALISGVIVGVTFFARQPTVYRLDDWVVWGLGAYIALLAMMTMTPSTAVFGLVGLDIEPTTLAGCVAILMSLWAGRMYGIQGKITALSLFLAGGSIAAATLYAFVFFSGNASSVQPSLVQVLGMLLTITSIDSLFFFLRMPARSRHTVVHGVVLLVSLPILVLFWMPGSIAPSTVPVLTQGEVVPSQKLTYLIASSVMASGPQAALFGIGPGEFVQAWYAFRPLAINRTPLWDQEPHSGYSFVLTSLIEYGSIFISVCAAAFVMLFVYALRHISTQRAQVLLVTLIYGSVILNTSTPPTMAVVLLYFFIGAQWGALDALRARGGISSLTKLMASIAAGGLIVLGVLLLVARNNERAVQSLFNATHVSLAESGSFLELHQVQQPALMVSVRLRLQFIADIRARALAQSTLTPDEIAALREGSLSAIRYAGILRTRDGLLSTAFTEINHRFFLIQTGEQDASQIASLMRTMQHERSRNPVDPRMPYWLALGHLLNDNIIDARKFAELALALKPDYLEAENLLAEMLTMGNVPVATE
ncbi:MAG: hypothetical protein KBE09_02170 [Candidatus Pacebacteria bacterium]|nr:hypothetical protein [Candidatus Paceibacterota bacterium]